MSGITKTIPSKEGIEAVNRLYDGSIDTFEFHMAGKPSKLKVGDYVYTIFNDLIVGKLVISSIVVGHINPESGKSRTLINVNCPGIQLTNPIQCKGHRGTRYYKED